MKGTVVIYCAFTSMSTLFLPVLEQLKQKKAYNQKLCHCMSVVVLNKMKKKEQGEGSNTAQHVHSLINQWFVICGGC